MRRVIVTLVLASLALLVAAVPALASTAPANVSGNEILIARALKARGVIPAGATKAQVRAAVQKYLRQKVGAKPEDGAPVIGGAATLGGEIEGFGVNEHGQWNVQDGVAVDNALVILVQFGGRWRGKSGPLAGAIPAPVEGDNTTFWSSDFTDPQHYQDMLFGDSYEVYDAGGSLVRTSSDTMRNYFLEQSHGAFTFSGSIGEWVTLPYPELYYGKDSATGTDDANGSVWRLVEDALTAFAAENPGFDWAAYDHENPYGAVPGGFGQPDGYIDHLILVHAGVDQSAGGGAQGDNAIWAHSSWVDKSNGLGPGELGGFRIPGTDFWAGAYVVNPEDGGIGVFSHELGHNLGLPDEYDTTYLGESPSAFWTLMASGSWLGQPLDTRPAPMNAWDKAYLGWVDPVEVAPGASATVDLQPAATGDAAATAVRVDLPDKPYTLTLSGADGSNEWYSGSGDYLNNRLTTVNKIPVPSASPALTFRTWYEIEEGYDYGIVEVSTDGSAWTSLQNKLTATISRDLYGFTGTTAGWTPVSFSLKPWAGNSIYIRFRYATDAGVALKGWEIDDIAVGGTTYDDADAAASAARFVLRPSGSWSIVDGEIAKTACRYYIGEYRTRDGFDGSLANCYAFTGAVTAQWFPYNTGLHLIYRNSEWNDNDVGVHPGEGGWLPLDAHPQPDFYQTQTKKGVVTTYWRTRLQVRDASFSGTATEDFTLLGRLLPGLPGQPAFDDGGTYWYAAKPDAGVKLTAYGVSLDVLSETPTGMSVSVTNQ